MPFNDRLLVLGRFQKNNTTIDISIACVFDTSLVLRKTVIMSGTSAYPYSAYGFYCSDQSNDTLVITGNAGGSAYSTLIHLFDTAMNYHARFIPDPTPPNYKLGFVLRFADRGYIMFGAEEQLPTICGTGGNPTQLKAFYLYDRQFNFLKRVPIGDITFITRIYGYALNNDTTGFYIVGDREMTPARCGIQQRMVWVQKYNMNADLIWERMVDVFPWGYTEDIFGVTGTSDGGVMMAVHSDNASGTDSIFAWFVKVTADGCLENPCVAGVDYATVPVDPGSEASGWQVYPNPV